jgi:hypothetical protein
MQKPYDELNDKEKEAYIEKSLQWLAPGPKFITESENGDEYIGKVIEFSKTLYRHFPIITESNGKTVIARLEGL